jgi:hypothetical protein
MIKALFIGVLVILPAIILIYIVTKVYNFTKRRNHHA